MEYVLKADALTKAFGRFTAPSGLSVHASKRSICVFVGNLRGCVCLRRLVARSAAPPRAKF